MIAVSEQPSRRPNLTARVLRGLELAFQDPTLTGSLFGALSLTEACDRVSARDLRCMKAAHRWVSYKAGKRGAASVPPGSSSSLLDYLVLREKAELLDELMQPGSGITPAEASKRWTKLQAKLSRSAAEPKRAGAGA